MRLDFKSNGIAFLALNARVDRGVFVEQLISQKRVVSDIWGRGICYPSLLIGRKYLEIIYFLVINSVNQIGLKILYVFSL